MTSCGRCNVRKHRDINNGEKYIILEIYYKIGFLDKREVTSSESKDYMGRPGKALNTSMDLRNKIPNNKQNKWFAVTEMTNLDFSKLLRNFNNWTYIGYKIKQVHNKPTEAYFFLIKKITKLMKSERGVWPNFVKSGINEKIGRVNKTIWHVNTTIGYVNKAMKYEIFRAIMKWQRARIKQKQIECVWY